MKLEIENLTKKFQDVTAVDGISCTLTAGVYGLLGVNGAGKTTLMRMLCTLLHPDGGSVTWDGQDIFRMDGEYRRILGYLPQDFGFYPDFTVRDYLMYIASIKGIRPAVAKKRVELMLKQVGLSKSAGKKMKKLSGGMKRRAGIAQAMLNDPEILILDEPTAGLDPKGRDEILKQIAALKAKTGITVILVSHSMEDVAEYVERLIVMNRGRVLYDDTPSAVFAHYEELEKIGLAAPQVTYVMNELAKAGFAVRTDVTTIEEARDEILRVVSSVPFE